MKIVEIIGPPGSGKTTLCLSVQQALKQSGIPCLTVTGTEIVSDGYEKRPGFLPGRLGFAWLSAWLLAFHETTTLFPSLTQAYGLETRLKKPGFFRIFRRALKQTHYQKILLKRMPGQSVIFFDPGWIMRFINGYLYSTSLPSPAAVSQFMEKVLQPSLLVVLKIDPGTALKRITGRSRGLPQRMRQLSQIEWPLVVEQGNEVAGIISKEAGARGTDVLHINAGESELSRSALVVHDRLLKRSDSSPSGHNENRK